MDIKISFIIILILVISINIFLYINKMWIFKNPNIIKIDITKEGKCRTDLEECKCPIEYKKTDGSIVTETIPNYDIEKKFYKVRQDLMSYWSDWNECNAYGISQRRRIKGSTTQYDVYDHNGDIASQDKWNDDKYYKVNSCDLIPCMNYGLNEDNSYNVCKLHSEGTDDYNDDLEYNTKRCNPIITFQTTTDIQDACSDNQNNLIFNPITFDDEHELTHSSYNYNKNNNFRYGFLRGVGDHPVLIGYNQYLHN